MTLIREFKFTERWQHLRALWNNESYTDELLARLEQRDADLERYLAETVAGNETAFQILNGVPTFADEAAFTVQSAYPATPAAGTVEFGAADRTGLPLLWARNSMGMRLPVGIVGGFPIVTHLPLTGTTFSVLGQAATAVGTVSTPAVAAPGLYGDSYRRSRVTSAAVANSEASIRAALGMVLIGSTQGWLWRARYIPNTLPANTRGFLGLSATTGALGTTFNPGAAVNLVGFGWSTSETTMRFLRNDGAGTPTATNLGANFSTTTAGIVLDLFMWNPPGSSTVYYAIESRSTGNVAIGSVSSDLPAGILAPHLHLNNGGTAAACVFDMGFMQIESLF